MFFFETYIFVVLVRNMNVVRLSVRKNAIQQQWNKVLGKEFVSPGQRENANKNTCVTDIIRDNPPIFQKGIKAHNIPQVRIHSQLYSGFPIIVSDSFFEKSDMFLILVSDRFQLLETYVS